MEAADAPSTPTAEAKRPGRSAGAEAPPEGASAALNANPQQADTEGPSVSTDGHSAQRLLPALPQEEKGVNGNHVEPAAASEARPSCSAEHCSEWDLELSAAQSFEDGPTSRHEIGLQPVESQPLAAPETAHEPGHDPDSAKLTELKRQRSLEREAHFAQVRLALPEHTSPAS